MSKIHDQAKILADSAWEEVELLFEAEEPQIDLTCWESLLKLNFHNAFIIDLKKMKE